MAALGQGSRHRSGPTRELPEVSRSEAMALIEEAA
jgi:hypothetical protein